MVNDLALDVRSDVGQTLENPNPDFVDLRQLGLRPAPVVAGLVNNAIGTMFPRLNDSGASSFLSGKRAERVLKRELSHGCGYIGTVHEKGIDIESGVELRLTITCESIVILTHYDQMYGRGAGLSVVNRVATGDICGKKPLPRIL